MPSWPAQRAGQLWSEVLADLTQTVQDMLDFIATLPADAWKQRGVFPWPDQGTLAEFKSARSLARCRTRR